MSTSKAADTRVQKLRTQIAAEVIAWYRRSARELPWRAADASPWAVLISEIMLQQTPVERVVPAYHASLQRWPQPSDLAASPPAEAVRMWGRLGYPRRALRLHACAVEIVSRHDGAVPHDLDALLALPGLGAYTARAVAVFAFGQRHPVVDTNVRRVIARAVRGQGAAGPATARADLDAAEQLLPGRRQRAALFSVALMELGALVCTARAPRCDACPIQAHCAWNIAGRPPYLGPRPRTQQYVGTDRQTRGALLAVLRESCASASASQLIMAWPNPAQRERALASLVADGLAEALPDGRYRLPGAG